MKPGIYFFFFRMKHTTVVLVKSRDPTNVLPEKHLNITRLNKGFGNPSSKRRIRLGTKIFNDRRQCHAF